jgi:hypothetical protein
VANLQSYNRYSYVLNNPLRYVDPTGYDVWGFFHSGWFKAIAIVGGVLACTNPYTCAAYAVLMMGINTAVMIHDGADWAQVVGTNYWMAATAVIGGAWGGYVGGDVLGGGMAGAMAGGAVGGAASAVMSIPVTGWHGWGSLGESVLTSAAVAAATAGATYALKGPNPVSLKSAEEQGDGRFKRYDDEDGVVETRGDRRRLSDAQRKMVTVDLARARTTVDNVLGAVDRWNDADQANFQKWFGTTSDDAVAEVRQGFSNMKAQLARMSADNLDFSPSLRAVAYTDSANADMIDLGGAYFKQGAGGRAGTIIHELSHLNDVGATNSIYAERYGAAAALSLARSNSAWALDNAENWEYFARRTRF